MPRRAPLHPLHAARRRPVPVPAGRGAGVLRPRRDLPDRRGPRARAGAVVRRRAGPVRARRSCCLRDFRVLERYRYTIAAGGLVLLLLPRVPGHRPAGQRRLPRRRRSADLLPAGRVREDRDHHLPRARYLRDTRQVLVQGARRFLGVTIPPLKHFGPLLVVWGAAMLMLVFIRDLGSSLMFFGGFLALLYVATNRLVVRGRRAACCSRSAPGSSPRRSATCRTASTSGCDPFDPRRSSSKSSGYQIAQGLFAQADGGLFGTGLRPGAARRAERRSADPAGGAHRPDLRGDRRTSSGWSARAG